jgi:hypothetical protein
MKRHFVAPAVAAVAFMLGGVGPVWADGYEFFTVDRARSVKLAYVGQIREKNSGRIVREPAYFMVTEKRSGMTFPFVNDRPGHYRSPDIGESVEELAGTTVNPSDLEFELVITGYKNVKLTSVPRKNKGIVEVNFKVERDDAKGPTQTANTATSQAPGNSPQQSAGVTSPAGAPLGEDPAGDSGSRSFRLVFMGVAAATIIAGAAARTLGPRQSTAR